MLCGKIAHKNKNYYYVKRKKQSMRPLIVASFNTQSVKGNDISCKRGEISTYIEDNGIYHFFVLETKA